MPSKKKVPAAAPAALIPAATLDAIIERLRQGGALIAESKGLGFTHNGPLRAALREKLGREGYDALMMSKRPAGGKTLRVRRYSADGDNARPLPDDSGVPLVDSTARSAGWDWRYVNEHEPVPRAVKVKDGTLRVLDTGARILVLRAPDGKEYVQAGTYEAAHLLRVNPLDPAGPPTRLVLWEESVTFRRVHKGERKAEKLEEHIAAQKEAKAAKKAATAQPPEPAAPAVPMSKKAGWKKPAKKAPAKPAAKKAAKPAAKKAPAKPAAKKATKK